MQQPDINKLLDSAKDILCPKCDNNAFEEIIMLKKISALVSPKGEEEIIPITGYRCVDCKHILTPEDIIGKKKESTIEIIKG